MKKAFSVFTAILCLLLLGVSCSRTSGAGRVLNIYAFNDEFRERFDSYCAQKIPSDIKVNWFITPITNGIYQKKLDEALLRLDKTPSDKRMDLFLVEADYALKYVDSDITLDVFKDIGLTEEDVANQYKYTKEVMTDSNGALKGLSWQATPGGFIYRRSIAKDVLGTDDPDAVGEALSNWDKFDQVAEKAKAKGYFMLSGYTDSFRSYSDNMSTPWVVDDRIVIDPQIKKWVEQTKRYTELGYNNRAGLWSP